MLDYLTAILGTSAFNLLVHSYTTPRWAPHRLTKVVEYSSVSELGPDSKTFPEGAKLASMTTSGACYRGLQRVMCCELDHGVVMKKLSPAMATYQLFYGLVTLGAFSIMVFHYAMKKDDVRRKAANELRVFVVFVLGLAALAGTAAGVVGGLALLIPASSAGSADDLDAQVGWAQIILIVMLVGTGLLIVGFWNDSKSIIAELGGGMGLDVTLVPLAPAEDASEPDDEADERARLLDEEKRRETLHVSEIYLFA